MRILVVLIATLALAFTTAPVAHAQPVPPACGTPAPTPTRTPTPSAQPTGTDVTARILDLTNAERAKYNLVPLRRSDCLAASAQAWSQRMQREGRIYHGDMRALLRTCRLSTVGENVAYGYRTPEATVRVWMNSPGHRANILNPRFTQLGVGWSNGYATQQFGAA